MPTTKATDSKDPHKDLRVIWSGDNKTIVSDRRPSRLQPTRADAPKFSAPKQLTAPSYRKWKVIGPKKK